MNILFLIIFIFSIYLKFVFPINETSLDHLKIEELIELFESNYKKAKIDPYLEKYKSYFRNNTDKGIIEEYADYFNGIKKSSILFYKRNPVEGYINSFPNETYYLWRIKVRIK